MPRKTPPVPVPHGSKFCFQCATVHPLDAFAGDAAKPDGRRPMCRACDAARSKRSYASPDKVAERNQRRLAVAGRKPSQLPERTIMPASIKRAAAHRAAYAAFAARRPSTPAA